MSKQAASTNNLRLELRILLHAKGSSVITCWCTLLPLSVTEADTQSMLCIVHCYALYETQHQSHNPSSAHS